MKLDKKRTAIRISLLVQFALVFIFSCTDDDVMQTSIPYETCNVTIPNCDPLNFAADESSVQEITASPCHEDGGMYDLVADSKKYLWFTCSNISALTFESTSGEEIDLSVEKRVHKKENVLRFNNPTDDCPDSVFESIDEIMEVELLNEEVNIRYRLTLSPGGFNLSVFDGLVVDRTTFDDEREFWSNRNLLIYLNSRDGNEIFGNYSFSTKHNIMGQEYRNVYFNDNAEREIYYNKECGLIAFRGENGVLWKFKDIVLK